MLARRISKRLRRVWLRGAGVPVGRLISVGVGNAEAIAAAYQNVRASCLVEDGGASTLFPRHPTEDFRQELQPFRIGCETVLLDIRDRRFSFRNHLLHDPALNAFFVETLPEQAVLGFRRFAPRRCLDLRGTVAYLSNTWVENYYHWMQLTLPLLRLYRQMLRDTKIDYFYVGEGLQSRFQSETLARLGIEERQLVRQPCRGDHLLCAFYLHRPEHSGLRYRDVWGHRFVSALYPPDVSEASPRFLYIRRGRARARGTANESELIRFLQRYGFVAVTLDGLSVSEQAKLFTNAAAIVGTHGAALTNLLFARPCTKVIEIFPPGIHETSYFTASTHSGLEYYYMVGRAAGNGRDHNMAVDLRKLEGVLQMAGLAYAKMDSV